MSVKIIQAKDGQTSTFGSVVITIPTWAGSITFKLSFIVNFIKAGLGKNRV